MIPSAPQVCQQGLPSIFDFSGNNLLQQPLQGQPDLPPGKALAAAQLLPDRQAGAAGELRCVQGQSLISRLARPGLPPSCSLAGNLVARRRAALCPGPARSPAW